MRRLIYSMVTSLDGYVEDHRGEIDWHRMDQTLEAYMGRFLEHIDTIILGRNTYQMLASYWPHATENDPQLTDKMNQLPKWVFSNTLKDADWNATVTGSEGLSQVPTLKQQPGKDLVIFGGATLASSFIREGLIDEFHQIINPVVLGAGRPYFPEGQRFFLKRLNCQTFSNGTVILRYAPGANQT